VGLDLDNVEYRFDLDREEILVIHPKTCGPQITYGNLSGGNSGYRSWSCSLVKLLSVGFDKS